MTAGLRRGLGILLTAVGLVVATTGMVTLVAPGEAPQPRAVAPIDLDEPAPDTPPAGQAPDRAQPPRDGADVGPAGPAQASETPSETATAPGTLTPRPRRGSGPTTLAGQGQGATPTVQTPVAQPTTAPRPVSSPAPDTDVLDDVEPPVDAPTTPTPSPTPRSRVEPRPVVTSTPVEQPVDRDDEPVKADDQPRGTDDDCPRPSAWPWHDRLGNHGTGTGWGPPAQGCDEVETSTRVTATKDVKRSRHHRARHHRADHHDEDAPARRHRRPGRDAGAAAGVSLTALAAKVRRFG